jgi:hypothetical protein
MSEDLEPLDVEALAVLGRLRPIAVVPSQVRERVWSAVKARVALVPGGVVGSKGVNGAPERGGVPGWVARNPWGALLGALVLGGIIGAAGRGSPEVRIVTLEATPPMTASTVVAVAPSLAPWTQLEAPAASVSAAPEAPHAASTAPAPATGQELAAESAILDIARAAIARGEADHALAAVDRHASAFPHGMLREEREALGVKALVLAGRGDQARAREARFRARYPESLFLPALESALRSIP